jgi:hypothetical protein
MDRRRKKMTVRAIHFRVIMLLCASIFLAIAPLADAHAASKKPLPPQSNAHGASLSERAAEWGRWATAISPEAHPLLEGPCATGQSGKVWFLGGSFVSNVVERSCTVPSGTALFFPVVNNSYLAYPEDPEYDDDEAIRSIAQDAELSRVRAAINGRSVGSLQAYEVTSPVFEVAEPLLLQGLGIDVRNVRGATYGIYLLIPPLPVGQHVLTFGGSVGSWEQDITYHLTVKPRGRF